MMNKLESTWGWFSSRAGTVWSTLAYFSRPTRLPLLLPLVIFVVLAGALLAITGGLSYVAPFVYTLF